MATTAEKVEAIYASLDDDERATLVATAPITSKDDLPPALRNRLEAATNGLTADDKAEIVAVVNGDEVEGFGWGPNVTDNRTPWGSNVRDHRASSQSVTDILGDSVKNDARAIYKTLASLFGNP